MNRLLMAGLNHTTAPLAVREKLAFSGPRRLEAIAAFRERFPSAEFVLLSTCNRVELYVSREVHGHPRIEEIAGFLAEFHKLPAVDVRPHLYTKANVAVVEHLFSVASSLDSMVLGETQILGQVREAYEVASGAAATGMMLNPLFQRAIAVGKQIMHTTGLSEGRLSVASVAVEYARQIFETFDDKTVLCIGAGKIATLALTNFQMLKPGTLLVCNRDPAKAAALAERFAGQAVAFDGLADHMVRADIAITSTASPQPIIRWADVQKLMPRRRYRSMFLIDLALPRDVEEAVGRIDSVYLYNLDDLQEVVSRTRAQRADQLASARAKVVECVGEFVAWHRTREMGPVIDKLYQRSHQIAMAEVERVAGKLAGLSADERAHLEDLARRIVNKLLHKPVQTLRDGDAAAGPGSQYLRAMQKLFQLEEEGEASGKDEGPGTDKGP